MENSIEKIVERINELYHKKQTVGLTAEETEEMLAVAARERNK